MNVITNIDPIRARIMGLESATVFDDRAWQEVLADLRAAGRVSALADAERRMATARQNAQWVQHHEHIPDGFLDDCPCPMCKFERSKPAYQRVGVAMETAVSPCRRPEHG
jgi:hypothetical protein